MSKANEFNPSKTRLPVVAIARTVLAGFLIVDDEDEMKQSTLIKTHDAKSETSNSSKVRLGTLLLVELHERKRPHVHQDPKQGGY